MPSQRGQASAEYPAVIVLAAAIVAAVFTFGLAERAGRAGATVVCRFFGTACAPGVGADPDGSARVDALVAAERARAGFVARYGGQMATLDAAARRARLAGDLDTAEALGRRLALYQELLGSGERGMRLAGLLAASDAEFAAAVARGTTYLDGARFNQRSFAVDPVPGGGVVVWDFFITRRSSGGLLRGDNRGHADPLLEDVPMEKSRVMIVMDLESGRGQIVQTETCFIAVDRCNEPRPITLDGGVFVNDRENDITGEGVNLDLANQFRVRQDGRRLTISYDALNSLIPAGSIDGSVEFEVGPDGSLRMTREDRDDYPSQGIYQYRPGRVDTVDRMTEESVLCGAVPVVKRVC